MVYQNVEANNCDHYFVDGICAKFVSQKVTTKIKRLIMCEYFVQKLIYEIERIVDRKIIIFVCSFSAINNSRKHNATTFHESNDAHVQRIEVVSVWKGLYRVNFTDDEINSMGTFCKAVGVIYRKCNGKLRVV